MTTLTFDTLGYFERLKAAGVPESQAKVLADTVREQTDAQTKAMQEIISKYDDISKKELATKGDVESVRLEIERVRAELKIDLHAVELRLLKWQLGIGLAIILVMAKGFGWLGF